MRVIICLLVWSFIPFSQGQASLRSSIGIKKEITKKIDVAAIFEYRLNAAPTSDKLLFEAKLNYDFSNAIETFMAYRYGCEENDFSSINNRQFKYDNRIALGLNFSILDLFKIEKTRWKFNWTVQYQYTIKQFESSRNALRNKVMCKYDIKNSIFTPLVSSEIFYGWNQRVLFTENTVDVVQVGNLTQWRTFVGIELKLPKNQKFTFQVGKRMNYLKNNQDWIVKVGYFATLKKKKKE